MPELPSGTVTLLFTDIEGSTRLLRELGEEYEEALAEHRRRACARRSGTTAASRSTRRATRSSTRSPRRRRRRRPRPRRRRRSTAGRCACGWASTPARRPAPATGYVGLDVHLGARIAAAGHGGQVLLSARDTRPPRRHRGPRSGRAPAEGLRRAGSHLPARRRCVPAAQDHLEHEPPAARLELRGARARGRRDRRAAGRRGAARHADRPRRVGEDAARDRVRGRGSSARSATVSSGWRSPRCAIRSWSLPTIAQAVGAQGDLAAHVGEREQLLLVDNLEQVIDAAPALGTTLEACPNLKLLVTSPRAAPRARRGRVRGARRSPRPRRSSCSACARSFPRGRRSRSSAAASTTCRSRSSWPPRERRRSRRSRSSTGSGQRLDLLKGGRDAEPRQATLRATIEWSYDLLSPDDKQLFARLAVFPGCTLEAAEAVATRMSTGCSPSSRRVSSAAPASASGCSRRSASWRPSCSTRATRPTRSAADTPSTSSASRRRPTCRRACRPRAEPVRSRASRRRRTSARRSTGRSCTTPSSACACWSSWSSSSSRWIRRRAAAGSARCSHGRTSCRPSSRPPRFASTAGRRRSRATPRVPRSSTEQSLAVYERLGDEFGVVHLRHRSSSCAPTPATGNARESWSRRTSAARGRSGRSSWRPRRSVGWPAFAQYGDGDFERAIELYRTHIEVSRELGFNWFVVGGGGRRRVRARARPASTTPRRRRGLLWSSHANRRRAL